MPEYNYDFFNWSKILINHETNPISHQNHGTMWILVGTF